jgi:hypothetical protein
MSWLHLIKFRWHIPPDGRQRNTVLTRSDPIWFICSKYFNESIALKVAWRTLSRFDEVVIIALAWTILAQSIQREVCIVSVKFLRRSHVGSATLQLNRLCGETVTELRTVLLRALVALWVSTLRPVGRWPVLVPVILGDLALPDILKLLAFFIFDTACPSMVWARLIC